MKLGLALPQSGEAALAIDAIDDLLATAEASGLDSVWVTEQLFGTIPRLEPLTLLTHAAARTTTLRLGTAVLLAGVHNPVLLARSLATLDHLSGGRLDVGLGIGGDPAVNRAVGGPDAARGRHLDAFVDTLVQLWSGGPVTSQWPGQWSLTDDTVAPGPRQRPHPPLYFGGSSPAALQRAARVGDGWIGSGNSTRQSFAAAVRQLRDLGTAERPFTVTKRQYLAIGEHGDDGADRVRAWYRNLYPGRDDSHVGEIVVGGTAEACVDALLELWHDGADAVILSTVPGGRQQTQLVLEEVVPALRAGRSGGAQ